MGSTYSIHTVAERPIDPSDFLHPIDFIQRDHDRQRLFCDQLASLVDDMPQTGREELAAALLRYLLVDVSMNIEDEEELLAPLLGLRCLPGDHSGETITITRWHHKRAAGAASQTADGLDRLAVGHMPLKPLDFVISAFQLVEILTQHLAWEDETLLPLAATRLTEEDMRSLGSAMARRRGVSPPLP